MPESHHHSSKQPQFTIQDVIEAAGPDFLCGLTSFHEKVLKQIRGCGNGANGYHLQKCSICRYTEWCPRCCGGRNCTMCGGAGTLAWIEARSKELLPLNYVHTVVDLPAVANGLALDNQRVIYNLLFDASRQSILNQAKANQDPLPFLPAIVMQLQTWTQRMDYLAHIHCLVSLGGYNPDADVLVSLPHTSAIYSPEALVPDIISVFVAGLTELRQNGKLQYRSERTSMLTDPEAWEALIKKLSDPDVWKIYTGPTHGGALGTIRYLSTYVNKVAITNDRILDVKDGMVTFQYEDRKKGCDSSRTLSVESFLRLFCMHIVPKGFHRTRMAGLLSRTKLLHRAQQAPRVGVDVEAPKPVEVKERAVDLCPMCHAGRMRRIMTIYHRFLTERQLKTIRDYGAHPPPLEDLYYYQDRA